MSKHLLLCALSATTVGLLSGMSASAVTVFDFEDQTVTSSGPPDPGALTSLAMLKDGITATVTRQSGKHFDVRSFISPFALPSGQGTNVLSPFFDVQPGAFVVDFSTAMADVSLLAGDYQPSDGDAMTLKAYSGLGGTGSLLGSVSDSLPSNVGSGWLFKSLSLTGLSGANSIVLESLSDEASFPYSVFVDNVGVTPIPEPTSLMVMAGAFAGLAMRRRSAR